MKIGFAEIWSQTALFVRRESALLLPLSMSTCAIGSVAWTSAREAFASQGIGTNVLALALMGVTLMLLGNAAILALALVPGRSVAEAIQLGVRRLPRLLLMQAGLVLLLMVATLPLLAFVMAQGIDLTKPITPLPPFMAGYSGLLVGLMAYLEVRLFSFGASVVAKDSPLAAAVRDSLKFTAGNVWPIFGIAFGLDLIGSLVGVVVGAIVAAIFSAIGAADVASFLAILAASMIYAITQIYKCVFAAFYFLKASGADDGNVRSGV